MKMLRGSLKTTQRKICFAPMHNQIMAEAFGGGEHGQKRAEMLHRIKFDMPLEDLLGMKSPEQPAPAPAKPNPTESGLIQPNPTNFSNGHPPGPLVAVTPGGEESNPVKPSQTGFGPIQPDSIQSSARQPPAAGSREIPT